jgi:hypothetical protein
MYTDNQNVVRITNTGSMKSKLVIGYWNL